MRNIAFALAALNHAAFAVQLHQTDFPFPEIMICDFGLGEEGNIAHFREKVLPQLPKLGEETTEPIDSPLELA